MSQKNLKKQKACKKYKVEIDETFAVIVWVDATGHQEWIAREDAQQQQLEVMVSIGFIVADAVDAVQIFLTVGQNVCSNSVMIPKGCILYMEKRPWKLKKTLQPRSVHVAKHKSQ